MSRSELPLSLDRTAKLLSGLETRLRQFHQHEATKNASLQSRLDDLASDFQQAKTSLVAEQQSEFDSTITQWDQAREQVWSRRDRAVLTLRRSESRKHRELQDTFEQATQQATKLHNLAREKLDKQYEELKPKPARQFERSRTHFRQLTQTAQAVVDEYEKLMISRTVSIPKKLDETNSVPPVNYGSVAEAKAACEQRLRELKEIYERVQGSFIIRFAGSVWPWVSGLALGAIVGILLWLTMSDRPLVAVAITLATLFASPILLMLGLLPAVRGRLRHPYPIMVRTVDEVRSASEQGIDLAEAQAAHEEKRLAREYEERVKNADREFDAQLEKLRDTLSHDLTTNYQAHVGQRRSHAEASVAEIVAADNFWATKKTELSNRHVDSSSRIDNDYQSRRDAMLDRFRVEQDRKTIRAQIAVRRAAEALSKQSQILGERFPAWSNSLWQEDSWPRFQDRLATRLPIGSLTVKSGFDEPIPVRIDLEWLHRGHLVLDSSPERHEFAMQLIQSLLLRAFTTLPMGQLQTTIIDPEALGKEFTWLMPLADVEPRLVGHRVWTQPQQIAEQLTSLAYQIEEIIQQKLRDRYETLVDFNRDAGPIAEPFRLVVWRKFPMGIDEVAWRSLQSILASGPRCGIACLITMERGAYVPPYISIESIRQQALHLRISDTTQVALDGLESYSVELETPPSEPEVTELIKKCCEAALQAGKIEVPFESLRAMEGDLSQQSSGDGLRIPLGVSGVGRVASLRLGHGTAQHVLIAGKTGSGKSSLLHTLITSAVERYDPDQLRLVLLDFKKGVEFQVYAHAELAQADIIGIESRREFGLSALEYLDRVMQRRGELFREASVQDVSTWTRRFPDKPMPRILIVVDEFQELFIEDDKLSQQASMYLDRIVRQGRSFGIHVILASQTIGGSYSLPRTTLAQMAVRIALQCDGSDAMMILSEDNLAATRLRYSGQAIYNDAGGRIEANQPFQVAYLRNEFQKQELNKFSGFAPSKDSSVNLLGRQVVFEGHKPARWDAQDVQRGFEALPTIDPQAMPLLLGESLSIEPTIVKLLPRQAGRNVLMVSSDQELASNAIATMVRGWLQLQIIGKSNSVWYFDGSRSEDQHLTKFLDWLKKIDLNSQATSQMDIEQSVRIATVREVDSAIAMLDEELDRRLQATETIHPSRFIIISNLGRFRELRRNEDFSFGSSSSAPSSDQKFAKLLRDGPGVGLFCLCWADSWGTVSRFVSRPSLRDFEVKILGQMSANDSNQLIDSSAANKLEAHALIFFDEADGRLVKFRPYESS